MASSRHSVISEKKTLPSPDILQTLLNSLPSPPPTLLTKPILQKLYFSLLHLPPHSSSHLSTYLFTELSNRLHSANPITPNHQNLALLLLRCCLLTLRFLEPDPTLLLDKSRCMLNLLSKFSSSSPNFGVLEVFLDELLLHRELRRYLMLVDDGEKLFRHNAGCEDDGVVMEVISAYFVSRSGFVGEESPQLSLTSAMQLLGSPVVGSAPLALQAYVISMVSKCVLVDRDLDDPGIWMEYYVSAFEKSLFLYARHLSCLRSDKLMIAGGENWPPFESYVRPVTYDGINQVASFSGDTLSFSFETKSEFMIACDAYIKENEKMLNKSFRKEIQSVLNSVVSQILVSKVEGIVFSLERDASLQEIYLLASIVNLMSNSLIQIVQCMVIGSLGHPKSTEGRSFCKGYDFIIGIVDCFLSCCVNDSTQKLSKKVAGFNPTKLMLIHFAGFLPFCYDKGHRHLWKCYLLGMMAITNLIVFEDGNLEALKTLLSSIEESLSSNSSTKSSKVLDSSRIASKFQELRMLRSRNTIKEETCNGENFLKSRNLKQADINDLADFVVCKKEKDYTKYLKTRENYRNLKDAKRRVQKQERTKKMLWRVETC